MRTPSVIQTLLDKFLITDSCQKFALYEKINNEHPKTPGISCHSRVSLRVKSGTMRATKPVTKLHITPLEGYPPLHIAVAVDSGLLNL